MKKYFVMAAAPAMVAGVAGAQVIGTVKPAPSAVVLQERRQRRLVRGRDFALTGSRASGWSDARYRRAMKKKRNQARNRKAHR